LILANWVNGVSILLFRRLGRDCSAGTGSHEDATVDDDDDDDDTPFVYFCIVSLLMML